MSLVQISHVQRRHDVRACTDADGAHATLFVRYDAINGVHMQVLLHRTASARAAAQEGLKVDVAFNGGQASRLRRVAWRKSRYSNPSGNCVEAAQLPAGAVAVRNSRYPDGPALVFTRAEWDAFLLGARDGYFDTTDAG